MRTPDWRTFELHAGALREPVPDASQLVVWIRTEGGARLWERIGTVAGAPIEVVDGIRSVGATALRVRQVGIVGRLFGKSPTGRTWVLPTGASAGQIGDRRNDVVLAWPEDETSTLDEARLRQHWPDCERVLAIGRQVFAIFGVVAERVSGPLQTDGAPSGRSTPSAIAPVQPGAEAERALARARAVGDRAAEASSLVDLGVALTREGNAQRAVGVLEDALNIARQINDPACERDAIGNLAWTILTLGDAARGLDLLRQSLELACAAGDRIEEKLTLFRLGNTWAALHDPVQASAYYSQALALARDFGDWQHEAELRWSLAIQLAESGQRDRAAAEAHATVELLQGRGNPHARWYADNLKQFRSGGAGLPAGGPLLGLPAGGPATPETVAVGPGILRMALSAAKSAAKYLGTGLKTVRQDVHDRRLETCATCEHHTGVRCRVCGCFTSVKAWLPYETCPLGKWSDD